MGRPCLWLDGVPFSCETRVGTLAVQQPQRATGLPVIHLTHSLMHAPCCTVPHRATLETTSRTILCRTLKNVLLVRWVAAGTSQKRYCSVT